MADEGDQMHMEHQSNAGKWILTVLAVAFVAVSGYAHYTTQKQVSALQDDLGKSQAQVKELMNRMQTTESQGDALREKVGLTKQELAQRVAELKAQQKAAESRLEKEQKEQISAVSGEITGVKSDVGGVKTDVAKTQSDLAAAVTQLTSMRGDLSGHSSLIARNHDELEVLKHKGDRSYYEFTLNKGDKKPVGTVSLQLKKADLKKSRFTLTVFADDRSYEKKDRNVNEPLQFYSGKEPALYEIVVNTINSKNQISGYLSTPKNAPAPASAQ